MRLISKRGITVTSIVIYVMLFFMFTATTTVISSRINKNLFDDRGKAINVTAINKLEYNLIDSADDSYSVRKSVNGNKTTLTFSNGDIYVFDLDNKIVYKNGGKLIEFVKACEIVYEDNACNINITLNKYTNEVIRHIKISIDMLES